VIILDNKLTSKERLKVLLLRKGQVHKRGSTWSYRIGIGKDNTGIYRRKTKGGFKTKKEAQNALDEFVYQLNLKHKYEPHRIKLKDYLYQWLTDKIGQIESSTYTTYKYVISNNINNELGDYYIQELTPRLIQNFINKQHQEKGLHPESIRKIHTIIKSALQRAEDWDMISKNPSKVVSIPKNIKRKVSVWSKDEAKFFLKSISDEFWYIVYFLALTTGMRQSEILGLKWNDISWDEKYIHVRHTLTHDGKTIRHGTKTQNSSRNIAITDEVLEELLKHKRLITDLCINNPNNLVAISRSGTPINPKNLLRSFYRILDNHNVNLPKIRFHDLRHCHATFLLKNGINPKIVAERLGHSDIRMTLNTYSHLLPNLQREAVETFTKDFFG
jgi:integrase